MTFLNDYFVILLILLAFLIGFAIGEFSGFLKAKKLRVVDINWLANQEHQ